MNLLALFTTFRLLQPVPEDLAEVTERWRALDTEVDLVVYECGYENAFYDPESDRVEMCAELLADPAAARGILNHEMAHAFFDQHNLSDVFAWDEEFAADELGFLMSTPEEALAVIRLQLKWASEDLAEGVTGDSVYGHPPALKRAAMLLCLDEGSLGENAKCEAYFRSAVTNWSAIVALVLG